MLCVYFLTCLLPWGCLAGVQDPGSTLLLLSLCFWGGAGQDPGAPSLPPILCLWGRSGQDHGPPLYYFPPWVFGAGLAKTVSPPFITAHLRSVGQVWPRSWAPFFTAHPGSVGWVWPRPWAPFHYCPSLVCGMGLTKTLEPLCYCLPLISMQKLLDGVSTAVEFPAGESHVGYPITCTIHKDQRSNYGEHTRIVCVYILTCFILYFVCKNVALNLLIQITC
jgi:hypothetical protein